MENLHLYLDRFESVQTTFQWLFFEYLEFISYMIFSHLASL